MRDNCFADEVMQAPTGLAKPVARKATEATWRCERFAGLKIPGKIPIVQADTHPGRPRFGDFGSQLPVAAPGQRPEPDLAGVFVRVAVIESKPGIVMMAGRQPPTFQN